MFSLSFRMVACVMVVSWLTSVSQARVIDFEDLELPEAPAAVVASFESGTAVFAGELMFDCCWQGWAYSNSNLNQDLTVDPGPLPNEDPLQVAHRNTAYLPFQGSPSQYAVASMFDSFVDPVARRTAYQVPIVLPRAETVVSLDVTNTTWVANSILNGDAFSGPFGDDDQLVLWIRGQQAGETVGELSVELAHGSELLSRWTTVDLAALLGADTLSFALQSSDTSVFDTSEFLNTPAYFALDNLVTSRRAGPATDLTGDGSVDAADAAVLFQEWGQTLSPADFNGDSYVDAADAGQMFADWTGDARVTGRALPEPASSMTWAAVCLVLGRFSHRHRTRVGV